MKDALDQKMADDSRSSEDGEIDPRYGSVWFIPDRFVADGIETMDELIETLKATVKELKQEIRGLEAMRKDGVIIDGEEMLSGFTIVTTNPAVAEKYGFDFEE